MERLGDYDDANVAKRRWEGVESADPEPKRRRVENPWMTLMAPGVSPSGKGLVDIDLSSGLDNGRAMLKALPAITEAQSMFSTGNFSDNALEEPSINFVNNSTKDGILLPDAAGTRNSILASTTSYSDSFWQDEKDSARTAFLEGDSQISQQPCHSLYDVCFGMVILRGLCLSLPRGTEDPALVDIQVVEDIFKLSSGSPKHNIGVLHSPALAKLTRNCKVSLSARVEQPIHEKFPRETLGHKETPIKIVIYGFLNEIDLVNSILSDGDTFLQHPTKCDTSVPYRNPQFLVPPGAEMPLVEEITTESVLGQTEIYQALDNPWASEVCQALDTVEGPASFAAVKRSPRLQTDLKEHQLKALSMMAEKESGIFEEARFPPLWEVLRDDTGTVKYRHAITAMISEIKPQPPFGGILADEMGLGKTLSILALIAWYLDSLSLEESKPRATLVVTTLATIPGWEQQIQGHFQPNQIRMAIFHGSTRHKLSSDLMANDIVLTTYDTLRGEWSNAGSNSVLYQDHGGWARIVLDEAHHIRSPSSQVFDAACNLRARYRWCLTGTPIHNTLYDYAALLAFIKVPPFTGPSWKQAFIKLIDSPLKCPEEHVFGIRRLRKLIAVTCLRRKKDHLQDQLRLPPRIEQVHHIHFTHEERKIYDFFKSRASSLVGSLSAKSIGNSPTWSTMLSIIWFLRLICNHGAHLLPQAAMEMYNTQRPSATESALPSGMPVSRFPGSPESLMCFDDLDRTGYQPSSKLIALIENVKSEQRENQTVLKESPVKSVIFSFWTKMLDLTENALRNEGISFQRIDGKASVRHRSLALKIFNDDPNCTVMLASIGAVAEGVNLTAASSVHLVEPQWNPMVEAQAVDRVHRIGQRHSVKITRYIVNDSIETYVQGIQQFKMRLVDRSLGDSHAEQEKLQEVRLQKLFQTLQ